MASVVAWRAMNRLRRFFAVFPLLLLACLVAPQIQARKEPKIVVVHLDGERLASLKRAASGARVVAVEDESEALQQIGDADALLGTASPALMRAGKNLRWVQVYSAGVDRYLFPEMLESSAVLTNAKVIQGPNVADQAMALLLVLSRKMHVAIRAQQQHDWRQARRRIKDAGPIELAGKTALVVGYGGIGSAMGERVHGFGMKVLAVDPRPDKPYPDFVERVYLPTQLHQALARADVVMLAVPLTDETEGMMDAAAFSAMNKGALLINIARGKVVNTPDLLAALESGQVGGAGLDVTDPEPLPPDHPLWTAPNVVITPHMGGTSDMVWQRRMELLEENVARFVAGNELRNVVDKERGY